MTSDMPKCARCGRFTHLMVGAIMERVYDGVDAITDKFYCMMCQQNEEFLEVQPSREPESL